jgi:hypothetical protein
MSITLPRLPQQQPDWGSMQIWWQQVVEAIETQEGRQDEAIEAIAAAQAAADAANAAAVTANEAAEEITAGNSLSQSFIENFTPPVVSADNTGLVTIADHDRHYGDGTVVSVDGDTLATGEAAGTIVYIFYSQPSRAGGAVTYQYSTEEADAAQIGDVHNVGAVEIPAAGTAPGGYARPPGYGGVIP